MRPLRLFFGTSKMSSSVISEYDPRALGLHLVQSGIKEL